MTSVWTPDDSRWRRLEWLFLVLCAALFAYSMLVWRHVVGDGTAWQPFRMVVLTAAILLQSIMPVVRRRSVQLYYATLAASLAMLAWSVVLAR